MKTEFLVILSLSCLSIFAEPTEVNEYREMQKKSCANKVLSDQEYYDAALRGELIDKSEPNNFLNFSELKFIGDFNVWNADDFEEYYYKNILAGKISSSANDSELSAFFKKKEKTIPEDKEGLYRDSEGNLWFIHNEEKKEKFIIGGSYYHPNKKEKEVMLALKYIAFKIMNLLVGSWVSEVTLLNDMPGYIAIKPLSGFSKELEEYEQFSENRFKLEIAMDFVGLRKRHFRDHHGIKSFFAFDNSLINPLRNDFNYALFEFDCLNEENECLYWYEGLDLEAYMYIWNDIKGAKKAIESIINIGDDTILHLLGDCYNDLHKINVKLNNKLSAKLGSLLIKKKQILEEEIYRYFTIMERIEIDPESFTSEDEKELQKCINITFLDYASRQGLMNFSKLLLAKQEDNDTDSALNKATEHGHLEVVKFLFEKNKIDGAALGDCCYKPLFLAFKEGHYDIVKFFLANGTNPDGCCYDGSYFGSWLTEAVQRSRLDLIKLLLEKGVDPNKIDVFKRTPLGLAAKNGNLEAIKSLLDKGANPNIKDGFGKFPLEYAIESNHLEIALFLKELLKIEL